MRSCKKLCTIKRLTKVMSKKTPYLKISRMLPTTKLHEPIPTICIEVIRPMAVPRKLGLTTNGTEGHKLV